MTLRLRNFFTVVFCRHAWQEEYLPQGRVWWCPKCKMTMPWAARGVVRLPTRHRMWLIASLCAGLVIAAYVLLFGWPEVLRKWFE